MSSATPPVVRYMILCDDVVSDSQRPGKITIVGLTVVIKWPQGTTDPVALEKLVSLLILTDGRGAGTGRIDCINEETGQPVFASPERPISFEGKDPALPYGVVFKLQDCRFPTPGAYSVRFLFDGEELARQTVIVR
jgi:hypothetical protein